MQTHQENATWFDNTVGFRGKESVEHVATALHEQAIQLASRGNNPPRFLDLGAGDTGLSTYPFLAAGATVYAVDSSEKSLEWLAQNAQGLPGKLVLCPEDIESFVNEKAAQGETFDGVIARSFLHHIPDYLDALTKTAKIIGPKGVFLSYEDPPRYDLMSKFDTFFSKLSYYTHRLFKGNYLRGLKTLGRRFSGQLDESLPEDIVEYHIVRNGVDDQAIKTLFEGMGFQCSITKYFTTTNPMTKHLGRALDVKNSFAVLAYRN